jgi:hypothetical protein
MIPLIILLKSFFRVPITCKARHSQSDKIEPPGKDQRKLWVECKF